MVKESELRRGRQQELVFHLSKNGLDNAMLSIWELQKHQTSHLFQGSGNPLDCYPWLGLYLGSLIHSTTIYWMSTVYKTLLDTGDSTGNMQTRFPQTRRLRPPPISSVAAAKSLQSCPTLCNPIGRSPPGSPGPGILQAKTLEWVAISFSSTWKWKVKEKSLSRVRLFEIPAFQAPPSMGFSRQEYWSGVPLPSSAKCPWQATICTRHAPISYHLHLIIFPLCVFVSKSLLFKNF